jgi:hypothetical protein
VLLLWRLHPRKVRNWYLGRLGFLKKLCGQTYRKVRTLIGTPQKNKKIASNKNKGYEGCIARSVSVPKIGIIYQLHAVKSLKFTNSVDSFQYVNIHLTIRQGTPITNSLKYFAIALEVFGIEVNFN